MAENYFKKFPLIYYNNYLAVNITERSVVTQGAFKNPYLFYPYDISEEERPDQIADRYYNDQFMDWVLYLGNKTTDPYYDWYLSEQNFNNFLTKKYEVSVDVLQSKTAFYRNNWYENEEKISVSRYSELANNEHRFWKPYYNNSSTISGYERVQQDWVINTNAVRKYRSASDFESFKPGEVVDIVFDQNNKGKGQILSLYLPSFINVQHISGVSLANSTVEITESSYIYGRESGANVIFNQATNIAENIPLSETTYWSAVSIYDYERELNEKKRTINVLDNRYSMKLSNQLSKSLE